MEHCNKPNPPMLSSLGEGFNSEGKGDEGIIIAFFLLPVLKPKKPKVTL